MICIYIYVCILLNGTHALRRRLAFVECIFDEGTSHLYLTRRRRLASGSVQGMRLPSYEILSVSIAGTTAICCWRVRECQAQALRSKKKRRHTHKVRLCWWLEPTQTTIFFGATVAGWTEMPEMASIFCVSYRACNAAYYVVWLKGLSGMCGMCDLYFFDTVWQSTRRLSRPLRLCVICIINYICIRRVS